MLPRRVLILGGAASGKSSWAEDFTKVYGKPTVYIATGQAFDDEMTKKIKIHRNRRDSTWQTKEAPLALDQALFDVDAGEVCLVDCATIWLSNHMLAENDLEQAQQKLIIALDRCRAPVLVVSNEVGQGIVPDNRLARRFREAQGRLNIALATQADLVVQVIAGLPQVLKGMLP
ncbi:MAG: bifunctional adenosylcobinamide kinase/adenosylcobinamide-phosphate guanylyltransferase [Pseudomonadota bacterium]